MPMPPGKERGEIGNTFFKVIKFLIFIYYPFYVYCQSTNLKICYIQMWDLFDQQTSLGPGIILDQRPDQ
jgi:hypothetical protein